MKKKERKYVQTRMKVKDNIGGLLVGNDGPKVFAVEERVVLDLGEHVEVAHARQVHERDADVEARLARERKLGRRVVVARGRLDAVGSDAGYLLVVEAAEQRPQLADIGPHEQVQVEQDQRVHVLKATLQQPSSLELEISNIKLIKKKKKKNKSLQSEASRQCTSWRCARSRSCPPCRRSRAADRSSSPCCLACSWGNLRA